MIDHPTTSAPAACACGQACQLLTVRDVSALLKLHTRTIWRLAAEAEAGHGCFPKPLRLGPKTCRWKLANVEAYLAALAGQELCP